MKDPSLAISILALAGAVVSAAWSWWAKRWEVVYAKKADAYQAFLEQASVLAHADDTNGRYPEYLRAWHTARLVASAEVERALTGDGSINGAIQWLRSGDPKQYDRREKIRAEAIQPAMERVIRAMNVDLRKWM